MPSPVVLAKKAVKRMTPVRWHMRIDAAWSRATWMYYWGNTVECPVCSGRFRKFLPLANGKRKNVWCPRCRSYERHRLMWLYLQRHTGLFRDPIRFLHFAPEVSFRPHFDRLANLDYVTADLDSPLADVCLDITRLPFPDNTFDAILCSHVMEHIPDDRTAMSELFRVLRPGGWAIVQVPMSGRDETIEDPSITDPRERERLFGQHDHVRYYGKDFPRRLEAAGFEVKLDNFAARLPIDQVRRYGLNRSEVIHYCTKPAPEH